jgi:CheY-like chemotaxis protein
MTASAFEEDIRRSYEAGMNNHLAKPFGPLDMYRVLAKYIEKA